MESFRIEGGWLNVLGPDFLSVVPDARGLGELNLERRSLRSEWRWQEEGELLRAHSARRVSQARAIVKSALRWIEHHPTEFLGAAAAAMEDTKVDPRLSDEDTVADIRGFRMLAELTGKPVGGLTAREWRAIMIAA